MTTIKLAQPMRPLRLRCLQIYPDTLLGLLKTMKDRGTSLVIDGLPDDAHCVGIAFRDDMLRENMIVLFIESQEFDEVPEATSPPPLELVAQISCHEPPAKASGLQVSGC